MAYTFTKDERLRKGDFRGTRWKRNSETTHFLHLGHSGRQSAKKLAVVVPKRTGKAVLRNRMRRLVREFFRLHKDLFVNRYAHMIKIKKIPPKPSFREVSTELQALLDGKKGQ